MSRPAGKEEASNRDEQISTHDSHDEPIVGLATDSATNPGVGAEVVFEFLQAGATAVAKSVVS